MHYLWYLEKYLEGRIAETSWLLGYSLMVLSWNVKMIPTRSNVQRQRQMYVYRGKFGGRHSEQV